MYKQKIEYEMLHVYKQISENDFLHVNVTCPLINRLEQLPDDGDYKEITEEDFDHHLAATLHKILI